MQESITRRYAIGAARWRLVYSSSMSHAGINYRALAVSERLELVTEIWDSIAAETGAIVPELSAEQRQELHARLAAHEADPTSSIPWDEVRAELFKSRP